jgi:hypothetical protein
MDMRSGAWKLADEQLLTPQTILPSQLLEPTTWRRRLAGEHRLMLAILDDAVETYYKTSERHPLFREAREWIDGTDRSWLFSFESICEALGLEPDCVRRGLRARRRRDRKHRQAAG